MNMLAVIGIGRLNLMPEIRPVFVQLRYKRKFYFTTTTGPNYAFRPGHYIPGTRDPPLKYFSVSGYSMLGCPLDIHMPGSPLAQNTASMIAQCDQTPCKRAEEPYGLQGVNNMLPGKGKIALRLPVKMQLKKDRVYTWCSCGHSVNQPLCDGSHKREDTKLKPVRFIPEKDMEVWFCGCKQTNNRPFCDGSHESLPPPPPPPDRPPLKLKG